jgi:hypothetical protein
MLDIDQKIYQLDPLLCPKCQDKIRDITFIEEADFQAIWLSFFSNLTVRPTSLSTYF